MESQLDHMVHMVRPAKRQKTESSISRSNNMSNVFHALQGVELDEPSTGASRHEHQMLCLFDNIEDIESMRSKIQRLDKLLSNTSKALQIKQQTRDMVIPIEVLRLLCQSGYLSSADIAKFFLLSNKSFAEELSKEFIFKYVLNADFVFLTDGDDQQMDRIVQKMGGGSYQRAWLALRKQPKVKLATKSISKIEQFPQARLSAENLVLVISFWNKSSRLYSLTLSKDHLRRLMESTETTCKVNIPESVFLTSKDLVTNYVEGIKARSKKKFKLKPEDEWPVLKIHCIRKDNQQVCKLYDSVFVWNRRVWNVNITAGAFNSLPFQAINPLLPTETGHRLLARWLQTRSSDTDGVHSRSGLTFSALLEKDKFTLSGQVVSQDLQIRPGTERHGVTMYHLLEELDAWGET